MAPPSALGGLNEFTAWDGDASTTIFCAPAEAGTPKKLPAPRTSPKARAIHAANIVILLPE
jgi:hypothetical protein